MSPLRGYQIRNFLFFISYSSFPFIILSGAALPYW